MKSVQMGQKFGKICGDGSLAFMFLHSEVLPAIRAGEFIEFDFADVRLLNSSFSNALFGNLVKIAGKTVLAQVSISNAQPLIRAEIKSGIAFGVKNSQVSSAA